MRSHWKRNISLGLFAAFALSIPHSPAAAEETLERRTLKMGKLSMVTPKDWVRKKPRVRIIAYEFAAPAAKGDKIDGRLTVMSAGGTIDANLDRWYGQFTQDDGGDTKKLAKLEKKKIAGQTVHLVNIAGTYKDQRGPFTKAVYRKKFRMLAAIVETKRGNLFIKFYGPKKTIAKHEKAFQQMIEKIKSD